MTTGQNRRTGRRLWAPVTALMKATSAKKPGQLK